MADPKVYIRRSDFSVLIGPAGAWVKGDRVAIPGRSPGTMDSRDPGSPAFDGEVGRVDVDGLAWVGLPVAEEEVA